MCIPRWIAAVAILVITVLAVAACSGGGGTSAGHRGTATMAWVGASPNFIFPLAPATNTNGYNENLTEPLWPPLVYDGDGGKTAVNPQESLYSSITYSNGDKKVTIDLKQWKWSDGHPVTSRDFTFVYNLLKANVPELDGYYVPGLFPDDVAKRGHAQRPHGRTEPHPLLQPGLLHRRRAGQRPDPAAARLGQDLLERPGRERRRDHSRSQGGVRLPAEGGWPDEHVHHQPDVEGGRRAVEAGVFRQQRRLGLRPQPGVLRPRQAHPVPDEQRAVHHRHRRAQRAAVRQQPRPWAPSR